jgi:polyhydroxyalkanoate synthesis regulator phasin
MGLLSGILTLPLAPVRGVVWIAETVAEEAERQMAIEGSTERALAELDELRATGEISEEEAEEVEAELIERLLSERGTG